MGTQIYYEDVETGAEIPALVKRPTTRQLVEWAGASGDFYPIHYDKDFALSQGLPGVIVHGPLKYQWLVQLITDWLGQSGTIRRLKAEYRDMDFPGDIIACRGRVIHKYSKNGGYFVDCEVWIENQRGVTTTRGIATVGLPSRLGAS